MKNEEIKWDENLAIIDRRFLNKDDYHSTAAVVAKISKNSWGGSPFAEFFISNCDRTISLDIDADDEKDLDNSIYKMQQIIEVATSLQKGLENLRPYLKALKEQEKRKKEEKKLAEKNKE